MLIPQNNKVVMNTWCSCGGRACFAGCDDAVVILQVTGRCARFATRVPAQRLCEGAGLPHLRMQSSALNEASNSQRSLPYRAPRVKMSHHNTTHAGSVPPSAPLLCLVSFCIRCGFTTCMESSRCGLPSVMRSAVSGWSGPYVMGLLQGSCIL